MTSTTRERSTTPQHQRGGVEEHGSERVVVGYDGSPGALQALEWAALEAQQRTARLRVLHAVDVRGGIARTPALRARYAQMVGSRRAEEGAARAATLGGTPDDGDRADPEVRLGSPTGALLTASSRADLVVVGSRGRGSMAAAVLGSVAFAVTAGAQCPVVVVRGDAGLRPGAHRPVVVGVDGSPAAVPAVVFAAEAAARSRARLVVLSAWSPLEGTDAAPGDAGVTAHLREAARVAGAEAAAAAREVEPGLEIEVWPVRGPADDALVASSSQAGLLVVGARGRGAVRGLLLGSVSHATVHRASCPVAVVRALPQE